MCIRNKHNDKTISLFQHAHFTYMSICNVINWENKIKIVCNINQSRKDLQRHPISLTESDYECILDTIKIRDNVV